jgi:hypothetical protein
MDEITPAQEALADDAAKAIVATAAALHPGDPVKQAACALNAALHMTAIWPDTRTLVQRQRDGDAAPVVLGPHGADEQQAALDYELQESRRYQ